jgi:hypothetical protein
LLDITDNTNFGYQYELHSGMNEKSMFVLSH